MPSQLDWPFLPACLGVFIRDPVDPHAGSAALYDQGSVVISQGDHGVRRKGLGGACQKNAVHNDVFAPTLHRSRQLDRGLEGPAFGLADPEGLDKPIIGQRHRPWFMCLGLAFR